MCAVHRWRLYYSKWPQISSTFLSFNAYRINTFNLAWSYQNLNSTSNFQLTHSRFHFFLDHHYQFRSFDLKHVVEQCVVISEYFVFFYFPEHSQVFVDIICLQDRNIFRVHSARWSPLCTDLYCLLLGQFSPFADYAARRFNYFYVYFATVVFPRTLTICVFTKFILMHLFWVAMRSSVSLSRISLHNLVHDFTFHIFSLDFLNSSHDFFFSLSFVTFFAALWISLVVIYFLQVFWTVLHCFIYLVPFLLVWSVFDCDKYSASFLSL